MFLTDLSDAFDAARDEISKVFKNVSPNKLHFFNSAFQFGANALKRACTDFVIKDDALLLTFLRKHPDKATILNEHPEKVRKLWYDYLFTGIENDFPVIASLLRNQLIPPEQKDECMRYLVDRGAVAVPDDIDNITMEENGFYRQLENGIVSDSLFSQFNWANKSKSLIVKFIAEHPLSEQLARTIFSEFNLVNYPWDLASHLNDLFRTNKAKRDEYFALSKKYKDIGRPHSIQSLAFDQ